MSSISSSSSTSIAPASFASETCGGDLDLDVELFISSMISHISLSVVWARDCDGAIVQNLALL
jgi:hypothetical protein